MVLVIGIGNTLRRDDGAGWLLAEALAAELTRTGVSVALELHHQLTPELAEDIAEQTPTALIFVDASAAVTSPVITPLGEDAPTPQQATP